MQDFVEVSTWRIVVGASDPLAQQAQSLGTAVVETVVGIASVRAAVEGMALPSCCPRRN